MRYRATNSTSFRNVSVALGLLVGSYVMSAFVNASPITQPKLTGPSAGRVIVVAPPADAEGGNPSKLPAAGTDQFALETPTLRSL